MKMINTVIPTLLITLYFLIIPSLIMADTAYLGKKINNMHVDQYMSQVVPWAGINVNSQHLIDIRYSNFGRSLVTLCPTIVNDTQNGNILTVCVKTKLIEVLLRKQVSFFVTEIAPKTLKVLAERKLPYRYGNIIQQAKDTSGGAYFLKDNHNRIIIGTADREIHRYALT